jgi:hypothetical protein
MHHEVYRWYDYHSQCGAKHRHRRSASRTWEKGLNVGPGAKTKLFTNQSTTSVAT